ncbi:HAD family hydrolase [Paenibacillus periandrae]|uniref:HAD family hydrolase n=1 Tax=Paenibacillus periandrae TaxID=1761741 RepID=UPI001F09831A|nr:HAD family hydrolase [Paenibacillus periandrae]
MKNKKVILFDLDDTLIDTFSKSYLKISYAFRNLEIPPPTMMEFGKVYGKSSFPTCMLEWLDEMQLPVFMQYYEESKPHFPYILFSSIHELNQHFARAGVKVGIVTNTPADRIMSKMEQVGLHRVAFDYVRSNAKKPNPEGILSACSFFQVEPSEVLYIGDSLIDLATARSSSVDFFAVTTGNTERNHFIESGVNPSYVFDSLSSLFHAFTQGVSIYGKNDSV